MKRSRTHIEDYTIAWICALPVELSAATIVLDERYDDIPELAQYILGRIGSHDVVVTCLPSGQYGTNSAALTAAGVQSRFPSIRYWLMVGIGGGVPSTLNDIRLGDVVVSQPQNQHNGVIQYDLGKTGPNDSHTRTGTSNAPPPDLGRAVSRMRSAHDLANGRLQTYLSAFSTFGKFQRRPEDTDVLFQAEYAHSGGADCQNCSSERMIPRPRRELDGAVVHFGLIASGNQVIKDGLKRDKLSAELGGALCFEMEAAGLVNNFPCLVIRGICDYADSHKNKRWQSFAAASAAACAKEVLSYVSSVSPSSSQIQDQTLLRSPSVLLSEVEPKPCNFRPSPPSSGEAPAESSQINSTFVKLPLTSDQREQFLASLTFENINSRHATIRQAHAKTCRWVFEKPELVSWLDDQLLPEHHGFMWVKGNPGTGKSTLLKYALAKIARTLPEAVIVSFFFNARGDSLEKSTIGMYRSVLFQILARFPEIQDVFTICRPKVDHVGQLTWTIDILKSALEYVVEHIQSRSIIIFIDALDECDEAEIRDMFSFFEVLGENAIEHRLKLRTFFTSRHYPHVTIEDSVQLTLENQEDHQQDIARYLYSELKAGHTKFMEEIRSDILTRSSGIFLWVVLVVQILNKELSRGNKHNVKRRLTELPDGLERLFEEILTRDEQDLSGLVLCVQWVLFARHALKAEELYFAMLADDDDFNATLPWDTEEIDLEDMKRFIVDRSKGLVEETRTKSRRIQFIHESVRNFFLSGKGLNRPFFGSMTDFEARSHETLRRCCQTYWMKIDKQKILPSIVSLPKASTSEARSLREKACISYPLLDYSVRHMLHHSDQAERLGISQQSFIAGVSLKAWVFFNNLLEYAEIRRYTEEVSLLYIVAEKNWPYLIPIAYELAGGMHVAGERYGYPIIAAQASGNEAAIRALIECQLKSNSSDLHCSLEKAVSAILGDKRPFRKAEDTSLFMWALRSRNDDICRIFHKDIKTFDPLAHSEWLNQACISGCFETAKILVTRGHRLKRLDDDICEAIVRKGGVEMCEFVLDVGLHYEASWDSDPRATHLLLQHAALQESEEMVKVILASNPSRLAIEGVLVSVCAKDNQTIFELLLTSLDSMEDRRGADTVYETSMVTEHTYGRCLEAAIWRYCDKVFSLLLTRCITSSCMPGGDDHTSKMRCINPALHTASKIGNTLAVRLLVAHGADVNHRAPNGDSALFEAVNALHVDIVYFLLQSGAHLRFLETEYCLKLRQYLLTDDQWSLEALEHYGLANGFDPYTHAGELAYTLASLGPELNEAIRALIDGICKHLVHRGRAFEVMVRILHAHYQWPNGPEMEEIDVQPDPVELDGTVRVQREVIEIDSVTGTPREVIEIDSDDSS